MADTDHPMLFLLLATALWLGIGFAMARVGGWRTLATYYRAAEPFQAERRHFISASIGLVAYHSCLTLGANTRGLFISVWLPFRFSHPSLFVPWCEVDSIERCSEATRPLVRFHLRRAPCVALKISRDLARAMISKAHGRSLPLGASALLGSDAQLGETTS